MLVGRAAVKAVKVEARGYCSWLSYGDKNLIMHLMALFFSSFRFLHTKVLTSVGPEPIGLGQIRVELSGVKLIKDQFSSEPTSCKGRKAVKVQTMYYSSTPVLN